MIEDTPSTVPETETSKTADESTENFCLLTEPVPSTSGLSEKDTLSVDTETRETAASNEEEVENIDLSKQENEPPSQSQKEESVDKNNKELENLNTSETTVNVDTSDTLNTVELDSTISVAQNKNDNGTEAQSDSNKLEISSVVETQAIGESKKLAVKEEEPVASHQKKTIPEGFHRTKESDTTEHSKLRSSEEGNVVGNVGNLSPQVAADETPVINEGVRTSQMYPELDTIARESGIYI